MPAHSKFPAIWKSTQHAKLSSRSTCDHGNSLCGGIDDFSRCLDVARGILCSSGTMTDLPSISESPTPSRSILRDCNVMMSPTEYFAHRRDILDDGGMWCKSRFPTRINKRALRNRRLGKSKLIAIHSSKRENLSRRRKSHGMMFPASHGNDVILQ
jgi:hypothetical protein